MLDKISKIIEETPEELFELNGFKNFELGTLGFFCCTDKKRIETNNFYKEIINSLPIETFSEGEKPEIFVDFVNKPTPQELKEYFKTKDYEDTIVSYNHKEKELEKEIEMVESQIDDDDSEEEKDLSWFYNSKERDFDQFIYGLINLSSVVNLYDMMRKKAVVLVYQKQENDLYKVLYMKKTKTELFLDFAKYTKRFANDKGIIEDYIEKPSIEGLNPALYCDGEIMNIGGKYILEKNKLYKKKEIDKRIDLLSQFAELAHQYSVGVLKHKMNIC